jgi:hypothetical protein
LGAADDVAEVAAKAGAGVADDVAEVAAKGVAGVADDAAKVAAKAAPGIGKALGRLGARALKAVPLIGVGVAGAIATSEVANAAEAHSRGELTDAQFAAVTGGAAVATAGAAAPFVGGEVAAEAARAGQAAMGVPEEYRTGTVRAALTDLGIAVNNATKGGESYAGVLSGHMDVPEPPPKNPAIPADVITQAKAAASGCSASGAMDCTENGAALRGGGKSQYAGRE